MREGLGLVLPGTPSLVFLGYILVFLPWAALRSRARLATLCAQPAGAGRPATREAIWISTLVSLVVLLVLAVLVGRSFGYDFLAPPPLTLSTLLATLGALAACFAARRVARALRSEEQRRGLMVYVFAPRTPREHALGFATVLVAGVAEECAYRGVGMSVLWYALGDPWLPVLILAAAFAIAHAIQGWKSGLVVFAIALAMHALVQITESLLPAVLVHITYDLVAGALIAREARAFDTEAATGDGT